MPDVEIPPEYDLLSVNEYQKQYEEHRSVCEEV